MNYTELQVTTNFSFLQGASHPEEYIAQAARLSYPAIGISDVNSFAGIVRAHVAAKAKDIRILPGCQLRLMDGTRINAYPTSVEGYRELSALLTRGNLRAEKGDCHLEKTDVFETLTDVRLIFQPPQVLDAHFHFERDFKTRLQEFRNVFGNKIYLAATRRYLGDDAKQFFRLSDIARACDLRLVATNDVFYHAPERRPLQDVLTCIREKCTIQEAGFRLHANAERHLKPAAEMERLFRQYPDAIRCTQEIAEACQFSLDMLKYDYPEEITSEGRTPQEELAHLSWQGARAAFGDPVPEKTSAAILHELSFINEKNYAPYFLTVYDIVRYAREQNILCQGRGSAANSTICYCLGITAVNPAKFDLLFERFISSARNEPPDIDVDFEHERREEVIQYIYRKYGRDRAAIVATVTQERQKGSIRDVGKAMGLSVDTLQRLSKAEWEFTEEWFEGKLLSGQGLNPDDPLLRKVLKLTEQLMGFPRQLGQHTGGFVITRGKLSDLCPVMNARMEDRTCIEWNKDDIDAVGFLKIDVLALGMLTCIRKAFTFANEKYDLDLTLANIPQDDPKVYEMISHADTIGVFQIESRAQQSMLPRLKPKCFYDLVIEVAIVRPGPIQGDMVHPYLRRRNGEEPVEYPSKELEEILGRTLGVPLFQEQAMKIAIVAAGFSASEADELRRSMATFKVKGMVTQFEKKLVDGMVQRGYQKEYAHRVFKQLEGFGSYGFPESHAASFALLVYVSSWIKCYYPDVFAAAILNSMPMGFYQPAQLVIDARKHGVPVLPVDINHSFWDNRLEEKEGKYFNLRLGFRQVKGIRQEDMDLLLSHRIPRYDHIQSLRDAGITQSVLEKLADADAFQSMGYSRRQALWEISTGNENPGGLFAGHTPKTPEEEFAVRLPKMKDSEEVVHDYAATSLSLKAHPVSFIRDKLSSLHIRAAAELGSGKNGAFVKAAGLVLVRQRPGTASGICFITIEDETGCTNLVVFQQIFEKFRKEILQSRLLMVEGQLQIEGEVIHVIVKTCYNLTPLLRGLTSRSEDQLPLLTLSRGDETSIPAHAQDKKNPENADDRIFYKGRNFR